MARSPRSPLSPREGWLSDGRQVLHFRPLRHGRWNQTLELTSGERLAGEPIPLLKRRRVLQREEAIRLWNRRLEQGWRPCPPQWQPPSPLARIGTALPSGAALPTDKPHNGGRGSGALRLPQPAAESCPHRHGFKLAARPGTVAAALLALPGTAGQLGQIGSRQTGGARRSRHRQEASIETAAASRLS